MIVFCDAGGDFGFFARFITDFMRIANPTTLWFKSSLVLAGYLGHSLILSHYGIIIGMKIRENVPILELTTMRLGGKARYVVEVFDLADLKEAYEFARRGGGDSAGGDEKHEALPTFILGEGANTIGRDEGFNGVIILNRIRGIEVVEETSDDVLVRASGGENWDKFVEFCCERGYSGIECLSAIPGTVGAAPVQNIGAYGQEISQTIDSVSAYDTISGEMIIIGRDEMKMSYRSTIFNTGKDAGRYFITSVTLRLENDENLEPPFYNSLQKYLDENKISDYSPLSLYKAVAAVRAAKLPDPAEEASAGSFFKNVYLSDEEAAAAREKGLKVYDKPDGRHMINTGWLIEQAGLKGREFYGFRVSEKAALILINEKWSSGENTGSGKSMSGGKAGNTYANLEKARAEIAKAVFDKFGYKIEQEPMEIGA